MQCIELLGMSRAGKTTQIEAITADLERQGLKTKVVGRPKVPFSTFGSPAEFHRHYLNYLFQNVAHAGSNDVVLLDRGFYDRVVLSQFDYEQGFLSGEEYAQIRQIVETGSALVGRGFLLLLSPEESLRRFVAQRKQGLDFSYLNKGMVDCDEPQNLEILYEKYKQLSGDPRLETIDANQSAEKTTRAILWSLKKNG